MVDHIIHLIKYMDECLLLARVGKLYTTKVGVYIIRGAVWVVRLQFLPICNVFSCRLMSPGLALHQSHSHVVPNFEGSFRGLRSNITIAGRKSHAWELSGNEGNNGRRRYNCRPSAFTDLVLESEEHGNNRSVLCISAMPKTIIIVNLILV